MIWCLIARNWRSGCWKSHICSCSILQKESKRRAREGAPRRKASYRYRGREREGERGRERGGERERETEREREREEREREKRDVYSSRVAAVVWV